MGNTGADVIVRKAQQFIARPLPGHDDRLGSVARHKWPGLARDEIGACEVVRSLVVVMLVGGRWINWDKWDPINDGPYS